MNTIMFSPLKDTLYRDDLVIDIVRFVICMLGPLLGECGAFRGNLSRNGR